MASASSIDFGEQGTQWCHTLVAGVPSRPTAPGQRSKPTTQFESVCIHKPLEGEISICTMRVLEIHSTQSRPDSSRNFGVTRANDVILVTFSQTTRT